MRASHGGQTGGIGHSEVAANFQRIGWGPVVHNREHDLGSDLFVQARDDRLFDRGLVVGVQVKAGPSGFERPVLADDGSLLGWWYYETDARHFDDWVQHGFPHLLVLHDLDTRVSYWVHVTADAVQRTGQGAKILVPIGQTIDLEHLDELLAVAATHKPVIALEGTAWTAAANRIAPARRLRHALLVPRLIAPHPNAGYGSPVEPEEAVALVVQGRLRDLRTFAERHNSVPDLDEAASSRDWRWQFVAGLGRHVITGDVSLLTATVDNAPSPEARAAASVVLACAYMDVDRYEDALTLLSTGLDEFAPVDHAWVLTQRARVRSELGDLTGARQDAVTAQRALVGDPDDVTASAIGAGAASLLFYTSDWGERQVDEIIMSNDTAVSWWRSQTLSSAFADATARAFRDWADERGVAFGVDEAVNNSLFAARINAHLAGEYGAALATGSLLARNTFMIGTVGGEDRRAAALNDLRLSGDARSVEQAARRLWATGPLPPLAATAQRVQPDTWIHTTARANLALWQHAGDLLDEPTANDAAQYCLAVLRDDTEFSARVNPWFLVARYTFDALAGLLPAAGDAVHTEVARFLSDLPPTTNEGDARGLTNVASKLPPPSLTRRRGSSPLTLHPKPFGMPPLSLNRRYERPQAPTHHMNSRSKQPRWTPTGHTGSTVRDTKCGFGSTFGTPALPRYERVSSPFTKYSATACSRRALLPDVRMMRCHGYGCWPFIRRIRCCWKGWAKRCRCS